MSHSLCRVWVHAIWSTKFRAPLISEEVESTIHDFMYDEFRVLGCPARIINGMADHVHCLFLLNPQMSVSSLIKQVKGSTSHFINQTDLIIEKFAWQTGYAAYSISESSIENVYQYIKNQKKHHFSKSFEVELDEIKEKHDL